MRNFILIICVFSSSFLLGQVNQFNGFWTKLNTTYIFEFELILNSKESNEVEGYFLWKLVRYDEGDKMSRSHYEDKLELTAKEYVKGVFNSSRQEYTLRGYKKEDPGNIIGMDTYQLKLDSNGQLHGKTNANGSWRGRINGRLVELDLM